MKRYLGLTEEEILENETLWKEERDQPELQTTQGQDLRSIGITPAAIEQDITTGEEIASADTGLGAEPGGVTPPGQTGGTAAPAPGAPPVPTI